MTPTGTAKRSDRDGQCWIIKTTAGGPGETDHWNNFKKDGVVAVGWGTADPLSFSTIEEFRKRERHQSYPAVRTCWRFAHEWRVGHVAVVCAGWIASQRKPVKLYGFAKVGDYWFDNRPRWDWRLKRNATITPVECDIDSDLLVRIFGLSAARSTIHGRFTMDQYRRLRAEVEKIRNRDLPIAEQVPAEFAHAREGAVRRVTVNAYERSASARRNCLAHWGNKCFVCGLTAEAAEVKHGFLARGLIVVHHVKPLASIGRRYKVDPARDLRPVCPNCHAVIHSQDPPIKPERIRALMQEHRRRRQAR